MADATLRHLENHGLTLPMHRRSAGVFSRPSRSSAVTRWDDAMRTWGADANHRAYLALVEACLRRLPEILGGAVPATDVMFPESSMHLVEGIYKHNLIADHFNLVLCESLRAECAAKAARGERGLRLLEIGAGTGGTTAGLLRCCAVRRSGEEYCYTTCPRPSCCMRKRSTTEFPALRTGDLQCGKPLSLQSIEGNRYDAVIATKVLHATSDMRETVRNAKALLKRGGMLRVNEMSAWSWQNSISLRPARWLGLYEDEKCAARQPRPSPAQWESLLKPSASSISASRSRGSWLGQLILAARSDGVVRSGCCRRLRPRRQRFPRARRSP